MKIRSKALYNYLLEVGVLSGTPELLAHAKKDYRRQYKSNWKRQASGHKEIRFHVSLQQHSDIKVRALAESLRPATYVKALTLSAVGQPAIYSDRLLEALQLVSMAVIAAQHDKSQLEILGLLLNAERKLLEYLDM
jgi:hypothetical protein